MSGPVMKLLSAEKRAAEIVDQARARRNDLLHLARCEVRQELDSYRAKAEAECKLYEDEFLKSFKDVKKTFEKQVELQMAENKSLADANLDKAVKRLLEEVCDIKCQLHINYTV